MNAPFGWWWPVLAGVAAVVAWVAGATTLGAVGATVAVLAAALALVDAVARRRERAVAVREPPAVAPGGLREAFVGGEPGREDIVLALDLLERKFTHPNLPARSVTELAALAFQPQAQFREYVAARLEELERAS